MNKITLYILILWVLNSCMPPVVKIEEPNCEVPKPECKITTWDGLPIDTSRSLEKIQGYYIAIEKVNDLDRSYNEFALNFIDKENAYLTYKNGKHQSIRQVLLITPDAFSLKDEIELLSGHEGLLNVNGKQMIFAGIPDALDENDIQNYTKIVYNSDGILRIPPEKMIGRSRLFERVNDQNRVLDISSDLNEYEFESHPALSPDGKVLFFSSTREGGLGSTDIWYSVKGSDGKWGEPVNAGPEINSTCDEFTPFITPDGKHLLFSSNGFETVGGHDIFEIEIDSEFWKDHNRLALKNRKNMRPPLNTPADEMFPSTPFDMDSILYYASDQNGGQFDIMVKRKIQLRELEIGSKRKDEPIELIEVDIADTEHEIDIEVPVLPKKEEEIVPPPTIEKFTFEPPEIIIEGIVIAENTGEATVADIKVKDLEKDEITHTTRTDEKGKYSIKIKKENDIEVIAENENNFYQSTVITKEEMDTLTVIKSDFKLPIELTLRINFPYDVFDKPYEYTLDTLGNESQKTWFNEMDNVAENIKISLDRIDRIILVGHTDYKASAAYNKELGLKRVRFVVDELEKRGIPRDKMEFSSAGESELLVKRDDEDDETYRKRLRRVTINKIYK